MRGGSVCRTPFHINIQWAGYREKKRTKTHMFFFQRALIQTQGRVETKNISHPCLRLETKRFTVIFLNKYAISSKAYVCEMCNKKGKVSYTDRSSEKTPASRRRANLLAQPAILTRQEGAGG